MTSADPLARTFPALMFQGTGSDVGKSLVVAGLCRAFARRGLRVSPFKPQNMSNNAAVTLDGGEIGRAQALQARAAGVPSSVLMNPILLKPATDVGAQVVVEGRVVGSATAREYQEMKPGLLPLVLDSFAKLGEGGDLVLVEGAGSAAEVNLRKNDIANMGFAVAAQIPVVMVGDIDRGGVIASIVGSHALLEEEERRLLKGYLINRFRGDVSLFDPAISIMHERTGMACFGVLPWLEEAARLPKEDAMALDRAGARHGNGGIRVIVPRLSRIANFDDLDPLMAEDDVDVEFVEPGRPLPDDADVILLPGTKATRADLEFLRRQGWDKDIDCHVRRGGLVVGLCGGYQMLGKKVGDPQGIEGPAGTSEGLGLLDLETEIGGDKALVTVAGREASSGEAVRGYEIHLGRTSGPGLARPWLHLDAGRDEGAVSSDGRVMGCYLHGLFAADGFRSAFLGRVKAGREKGAAYEQGVEAALDAIAFHMERHLDIDGLLALARA